VDLAEGLAGIVQAFQNVPGIQTASVDPSEVIAPGVLVQLNSLTPDTLGTWALDVNANLVVTDSDSGTGPAAALGGLLNACLDAGISPDGPVLARSLILPSNPSALPGLVIPLTVRIPA